MSREKYMDLALEIAFDNMGTTSPNPAVGAVIVKDGQVISRGGTCEAGSDHAEVVALKNALEVPAIKEAGSLEGAEMFVSLEPCSHHGKTPPCTEAIISAGIDTVHIAILDPNPRVAGRGVQKLKEAGVSVNMMQSRSNAASELIRPFKKLILRNRTYVVHKCAMTMDGKTATGTGDSKWISSPFSRLLAHKLREKVDAVIVGKNTFVADDPALSVRFDDFDESIHRHLHEQSKSLLGRDNYFFRCLMAGEAPCQNQPLRVLAGVPDSLDVTKKIFRDKNYLIFEREEKYVNLAKTVPGFGEGIAEENLCLLASRDREEFVHDMLTKLAERGIMYAMLEGGSLLAGSFFDAGEIDQFLYVTAPKIIGSGKDALSAREREFMKESLFLHDVTMAMAGPDMVVNGYREQYNFEMM